MRAPDAALSRRENHERKTVKEAVNIIEIYT
jgi:hypothetical protein